MPIGLTALWPDLLLPFAWGGLVGLVFSLVGTAGGILASFGLISVFGAHRRQPGQTHGPSTHAGDALGGGAELSTLMPGSTRTGPHPHQQSFLQ